MRIQLRSVTAALCFAGFITTPVFAATSTGNANGPQLEQLAMQTQSLETQLAKLQRQMSSMKKLAYNSSNSPAHAHAVPPASAATPVAASPDDAATTHPHVMPPKQVAEVLSDQAQYLPFDLDVPGQAFVSTGPYVGVPYQYAGGDLVVNSPSVNTDVQLLGIRKSILEQLNAMGGLIRKEPYHSHLLLSGVLEGQANYTDLGGKPSTTNIDVTNVSLDAFFLGPSDWMLGFIELTYDNSSPANSVYTSTSNYTVYNSRVLVNKAFFTFGDFECSPFYGSVGQMYVPFGVYSSLMVSDPLTKLVGRTKARSILVGIQQQDVNAFYAAAYIFRGDSYAASVDKINNGGANVGYKFDTKYFGGNVGGGMIGNLADSGGMQVGTGFQSHEQIVHRVPAYNLRGMFNIGKKIDIITEYVSASTQFNATNMSFNGHGAKPSALDTELAYTFTILCNKPSSVAIGYANSNQALALGIPLNRYSFVFNTSLWRNTLQAIEFRRDREYAASDVANGAGGIVSAPESGKIDRAVTASFDYYF